MSQHSSIPPLVKPRASASKRGVVGASSCPSDAPVKARKGRKGQAAGDAPLYGARPPAAPAAPFLVLKETTQPNPPPSPIPSRSRKPLTISAPTKQAAETLLAKSRPGTVVSWQGKEGRYDEALDRQGRRFIRVSDATGEVDVQGRFGAPSGYELRQKFCIEANTAGFLCRFGDSFVGFLTLTFAENLRDPEEAQRRFNSFWTHVGRPHFGDYLRVIEVQRRGAIHYHLLVSLPVDVKGAFDWDAFNTAQEARQQGRLSEARALTRIYVQKLKDEGCGWLVDTWAMLRASLPKYGFGRSELLPIRSNFEGMSKYIGKYIAKSQAHRPPEMKGVRLFSSSVKGWVRPCNMRFQFLSRGSALYRSRVARLAAHLGVSEEEGLASVLGKKGQWRLNRWLAPDSESECPRGLHPDDGGWTAEEREAWEERQFVELLQFSPARITAIARAGDRVGEGKRGGHWSADERRQVRRWERVAAPVAPVRLAVAPADDWDARRASLVAKYGVRGYGTGDL